MGPVKLYGGDPTWQAIASRREEVVQLAIIIMVIEKKGHPDVILPRSPRLPITITTMKAKIVPGLVACAQR